MDAQNATDSVDIVLQLEGGVTYTGEGNVQLDLSIFNLSSLVIKVQ
jgi:hypothetical protein